MEEALIVFQNNTFYLLISDIVLEGEKGTDDLLCIIQEAATKYPVVLVAGFPSLDDTVSEAGRRGAFDDISKPEKKEMLSNFVRQVLKHCDLEKENKELLQENETFKKYLETIFSSVRDAIITIDNNMNIVQLNATAKRWLLCKDIIFIEYQIRQWILYPDIHGPVTCVNFVMSWKELVCYAKAQLFFLNISPVRFKTQLTLRQRLQEKCPG